jgi:hypothetical protein
VQFILSFLLHSTYNSTSNNILQLIRLIFILLNCNQAPDWVLLIMCASGCVHFQVMMYFMINACRFFHIATFVGGKMWLFVSENKCYTLYMYHMTCCQCLWTVHSPLLLRFSLSGLSSWLPIRISLSGLSILDWTFGFL